MRLYAELAPWFHLVSDPAGYEKEAAHIVALAEAACEGRPETLLELGAGGGCSGSHLKQRFLCTLSDISAEMLEVNRSLNPECEHVLGDMRTLRLGHLFDVVLIHDAIGYMTSEDDLGAAIETAAEHLRPGGAAILIPDETTESFAPGTRHGGHDGGDGRALRFLEWSHPAEPNGTSYQTDYVVVMREAGQPPRVELDRHRFGLFSRDTWLRLVRAAELEPLELEIKDPHAGEHVVFVARAPIS
ncbi:MAG: class I SAM-dependent methyltransferase [Pseudomonadota bacterium]